jgi:type I restriction enzyme S subunit
MRSEWEILTLSDLSIKTEYGYTASAKDNKEENEPRFLRITDIQGGVVDWNTVPYCDIESNKVNKYRLNYGDIVVARTGNSTGENYMFDSEESVVYASYLIRYIINQNIAEPKFIWYQMRSSKWTNFINNVKGGSAQAGANAKTMGAFECFVPPLLTQKK